VKKVIVSFLFLFILTTLWNCDNERDQNDFGSQSAIVFVQHYYTGRRAPDWERIYIPSVFVWGDITGNPLPEIDYVQVADKKLSDPAHINYYEGNVHFSSYERIWSDSIPEPKFDPLTIKIKTDIGEIEGSITVPDTIESLTISADDTIQFGTPVTISWSGSDADYYYVYFFHNWLEGEGYWLGYSRDTIVTTNSITYDGSRFTKDGDISEFEVYPINGPLPEPGAEPNMDGDGYGYLYLQNLEKSSDRTIVIGAGIDYSIFEKRVVPTSVQETMQKKIKSRLGL